MRVLALVVVSLFLLLEVVTYLILVGATPIPPAAKEVQFSLLVANYFALGALLMLATVGIVLRFARTRTC